MDVVISRDRLIHKAILAATAGLPRTARVRSRERWLGRLQQAMLRRADILLIRHPKTGGTWLRVMLARLYSLRYGTSIRRVFRSDELQLKDPALPRYLMSHGLAAWERLVGEAFARGDPALGPKKVLFLARHPGDVVVSWQRQYRKRERAFRREMLEAELGLGDDPRGWHQWDFIRHPGLGLPAIIDYHNFWARILAGRENALIVRYEDLLAEPRASLARIGEFLGEDFGASQIADAVAFASADHLRKLEQQRFFHNASLRPRRRADGETGKVRRARAGAFGEDLTGEQAAWVEALIEERLDPVFGYAGTAGARAEGRSAPART